MEALARCDKNIRQSIIDSIEVALGAGGSAGKRRPRQICTFFLIIVLVVTIEYLYYQILHKYRYHIFVDSFFFFLYNHSTSNSCSVLLICIPTCCWFDCVGYFKTSETINHYLYAWYYIIFWRYHIF